MPQAYRKGDIDSEHGCFPPSVAVSGSPDVLVNGIQVMRVGDNGNPAYSTRVYGTDGSTALKAAENPNENAFPLWAMASLYY